MDTLKTAGISRDAAVTTRLRDCSLEEGIRLALQSAGGDNARKIGIKVNADVISIDARDAKP